VSIPIPPLFVFTESGGGALILDGGFLRSRSGGNKVVVALDIQKKVMGGCKCSTDCSDVLVQW
jgi:hypothetical protein